MVRDAERDKNCDSCSLNKREVWTQEQIDEMYEDAKMMFKKFRKLPQAKD